MWFELSRLFVTEPAKTRHNSIFFQTPFLLNFYNLHIQACVLAKFQLHILCKITALKCSSYRKINLYSKHGENKLQELTKTYVTYEWSAVQTQNLHHCVHCELRNGLLSKLFLLLPCIATKQVEIHEETLISNNCFDIIWTSNHKL